MADPGRVLLVEDDPLVRSGFERVLRGAGHQVVSTDKGASAAALLDCERFHVVVSDVGLPDMDGVSLLRRVRTREPNLAFILVTGAPALETAMAAVESRALHYLLKPIEPSALRAAVAGAVEQARAQEIHADKAPPRDDGPLHDRFEDARATLKMHYQPIISWSRRQVHAYEALVRPTSKEIGNPGALFEAATRLGRIQDLGRTIRDQVARVVAASPCDLFVNLHPFELCDDNLFDPAAPLSRHASRVVLEITERAALDEIDDVRGRMACLRELGFRVAVDDLGAGYSGLASVAQLEPDVVKLDMSMVRDVHKHRTKQYLIKAMIELFDRLGRAVIAEGVENAEEARTLVELGCDLMQGYFFGRPSPSFSGGSFPAT